jgi:hypothetical protein
VTLEEWRLAQDVDTQHMRLSEMLGNPYRELLDRYDYTEANCIAINATRMDPK